MIKHFFLKKNNIIFTTFLLFFIFFSKVEAITLDNTSYTKDGYGDVHITISCDNTSDSIIIYNLTTNSLNEAAYGQYCNNVGSVTFALPANNFSILEMTTLGICENEVYYYGQCKSQPEFVNEFLFSVVAGGGGGGGGGGSPYISAPSVVNNGASFAPVCSSGAEYFDVVGFLSTTACGQSISFGEANNVTFEIRPIDINFNYLLPSIYVSSEYTSVKKRIISYIPFINISSIKANSSFSSSTLIIYKATDQNDLGEIDEKTNKGLGDNPVSIFYTDKSFDWNINYSPLVNPDYKNLIIKDLPADGQYNWPIKDLVPGNLYRIIIDATDNYGLVGETVSDYFTVDFVSPVFKIKTYPTLVKSGDVKISVESSEDLQKIPVIIVTQKSGKPITVDMKGSGSVYEGSYSIKSGYDGTAKIDVEGIDLAGNIGKEIVDGGTFSIGVNPPSKPHIISDINNTTTSEGFTTIKGTVRDDTEVILLVNGTTTATVKPDSKGNFTFDKIKLDKIKNKGINYLSVISRDIFGTVSESTSIQIKYNIAPTISLIKPTDKLLLTGQTDIIAKGADANSDTLLYTFEIMPVADYDNKTLDNNWTVIATDVSGGAFTYDTTESDDGDYMLRVKVSDGYITTASTPVFVTIKSSSSYFRFENGRKTITKKSSVTINGKAIISSDSLNTASIKVISYSIDGGLTWENVKFDNIANVTEQKFSVTFDDLKEGINTIMWRIRDSRNMVGKGSHIILVDNVAPKIPAIKNFRDNAIITNDNDENLKKEGIQIGISGTAEARSTVSLVYNTRTLTTKASLLGEFSFSEITLDKVDKQQMQLSSEDEAGNKSDKLVFNFIYNNPPLIKIINPEPFGGISDKAILSWSITDVDGDVIKNVNVSYKNSDGAFKSLVNDAKPVGTYSWDTSKLPESNNYELKITATDSITPVSASADFFIDRTPPTLLTFNIKKEIANKKANFSGIGTAVDTVSGVGYVEYSIKPENDKEKGPWYKGTITKGYLQKQATFSIKYPNDLANSSYTVYARAVDLAGNVSSEITQSVSIDKISPTIGSFFIAKDNLNLIPDQDGKISYYKNSPFTFAVSIEKDAKTASLNIGSKNLNLIKNITSGLWEATTTIDSESTQDILITATDDSGNITNNKKVGLFTAVNKGNVILQNNGTSIGVVGEATIHIYKYNESTGGYDKFIPTVSGIDSVIKTDESGHYSLTLPIGKYQLIAVKSGFKVVKKDIILSKAEIVNDSFVSKKISGLEKILNDIFNNWFY
jgi:hypothetical protein